MKCKRVKLLSAPYIFGDLADDLKLLGQLEAHLRTCNCCTGEYQSVKQTIEFVEEYKDVFAEVFAEIDLERAEKGNIPKQNWVRISAESIEKPKSLRLFLRIGAVAACLAIGILTWTVFSNYSKPQNIPQASSSKQIASALRSSVEVELVRPSGNIVVATGEKFVADNELKTLLINGRHRVVMNSDTVLTVEPLVENSNIGCLVKLDFGQIYTHVEHDGNPFVIDTAHGKAVITGTAFDLKVTHTSTTLVVSEGTVRFESESGVVKVAAGQMSEMVGHLAPTIPVSCNTAQLVAWATGHEPEKPLDEVRPATETYDITDLPPFVMPVPIDLENIDYEQWVEQKRVWFQQQFPEIFRLREALAQEGIEVDYPDLLLESAVVWRFAFPPAGQDRLLAAEDAAIIKAANHHGKNVQWLKDRYLVPIAKTATYRQKHMKDAFMPWQNELATIVDSGKEVPREFLLDSFHACVYLRQTRSLVWLMVEAGRYSLPDTPKAQLQALLQAEVTAADSGMNDAIRLLATERPMLSCDSDLYQQLQRRLCEAITQMTQTERRLADEMADRHP